MTILFFVALYPAYVASTISLTAANTTARPITPSFSNFECCATGICEKQTQGSTSPTTSPYVEGDEQARRTYREREGAERERERVEVQVLCGETLGQFPDTPKSFSGLP